MSAESYDFARKRMVDEQIRARGVTDRRVLEVMEQIPRERFVPTSQANVAFSDRALPIDCGQSISQPFMVASMTEHLDAQPVHRVLEIGTGSGYQTAILARLARWVYSLELIGELAHQAIHRLRQLGISNVKIQTFDGTVGWSEVAPFDRILVAAGAPSLPRPLLDQLGPRGRLVIPEGEAQRQRLVVYERLARGVRRREADEVAFVPLLGRHGWQRGAGGPERG